MVNASLNWASIVGIVLAVGGAFLYFMRNFKPALARDYDVFFAAIGLLCGGILFFQGWRLDPILQFGQFLLAGTTVFFAYESVRLRGVTTEQARRSSYFDDEEPPAPFAPRPGFGGRSWEGDSLEEAEGFRRRIPSRDEGEDDFYRPRRPSRVAIPERAVSRGEEGGDWDIPRRRPEPGPGFDREPSPTPSRYNAGPSRGAAPDFGARRRSRDADEGRRGSRPVSASEAMPRSSRRPGGLDTAAPGRPANPGPAGVPQGSPLRPGPADRPVRGEDMSDADYAPLGSPPPQGRPQPVSSGRPESPRADGPRAEPPRSDAARGGGDGSDRSSPRPAPRDNSSRFDD